MAGRFTWKGLRSSKGQKRDLGFGIRAYFYGTIKAHIIDDSDEPVPIMEIQALCANASNQSWVARHDGDGVTIPDDFPQECREKLMKCLNDAFETGEDPDQGDDWWVNQGGQANWPPPRETWKDRR